jgi:hypothetical protein
MLTLHNEPALKPLLQLASFALRGTISSATAIGISTVAVFLNDIFVSSADIQEFERAGSPA